MAQQFPICQEDGVYSATHFIIDSCNHKRPLCSNHLQDRCMPIAYIDSADSYEQYLLLKRNEEKVIKDRKQRLKQWEDALEYQYSKAQEDVTHLSTLHPGFIPTDSVLDSLLRRKQKLCAQLSHFSQFLSPDSFHGQETETQLLQADWTGDLPFFLLVWNVDPERVPAPVKLSYQADFEGYRDVLKEHLSEITTNIEGLLQSQSLKNLFRCMYLLSVANSLLPGRHCLSPSYYQMITTGLFEKYNQVLTLLNQKSGQIAFATLINFLMCEDWRPVKALVDLGLIQNDLAKEDKQYNAEALLHLYAVLKALEGLRVPEIAKMKLEVSSRIGECMRLGGRKTQAITYLVESLREISEAEDDEEKKKIAIAHVYLGRCYKSAKDTNRAMHHYSLAKAVLDEVAGTSKELAKLLYYMVPLLSDPDQKIQFCDSAIQIWGANSEESVEIYGRKGNVYYKLKRFTEALECYELAHSLVLRFPNNHQNRVRLCQAFAAALIELKHPDRALQVLAECNASLPLAPDMEDQATALFLTGEALKLQGQRDTARVSFDGAQKAFTRCTGKEAMVAKCERRLKELGGN